MWRVVCGVWCWAGQVVKLQSGDEESRKLWTLLCDISRSEFYKVYNRLRVTLEEFGESFYNPIIPGIIDELEVRHPRTHAPIQSNNKCIAGWCVL